MVSITDIFSDGFSAVYTSHDPAGDETVTRHLCHSSSNRRNEKRGLPYLYLGFWIDDVPNMSYKTKFQPLEVFLCRNNGKSFKIATIVI